MGLAGRSLCKHLKERRCRHACDTNKPNKATAVDFDVSVIAGIKKYFANVGKLTFLGTDYSAATLTAAVQGEIDAEKALEAARAELRQMVADTQGTRVQTRALRAAIRKYILSVHGPHAVQVLEDFGFKAPKTPGPKTVKVKAEAQAKAVAIRKAKREAIEKVVSGQPAPNGVAGVSTPPAK